MRIRWGSSLRPFANICYRSDAKSQQPKDVKQKVDTAFVGVVSDG